MKTIREKLKNNQIVMIKFLKGWKVNLLRHPPYSPDLNPCDFWLFPKLKEALESLRFGSDKGLKKVMTMLLQDLLSGARSPCSRLATTGA